jgi:hypothetical protein
LSWAEAAKLAAAQTASAETIIQEFLLEGIVRLPPTQPPMSLQSRSLKWRPRVF